MRYGRWWILATLLVLCCLTLSEAQMVNPGGGTQGTQGPTGRQINQFYDVTDSIFADQAPDSSTDFTGFIQAAIDSCEANGGGTVYFPPGVFFINDATLTIEGSGIRLLGSGSAQEEFLTGPNQGTTLLFRTTSADSSGNTGIRIGDSTGFTYGVTIENIHCRTDSGGGQKRGDLVHGINLQECNFLFSDFVNRQHVNSETTYAAVRIRSSGDDQSKGAQKNVLSGCYFYGGSQSYAKGFGLVFSADAADSNGAFPGSYNNANVVENCFFENFISPGKAVRIISEGSPCNGHLFTNCRWDGDDGGVHIRYSYHNNFSLGVFDFADGDTAVWIQNTASTHPTTGLTVHGSNSLFNNEFDGLVIDQTGNASRQAQHWSHNWRSGPHLRALSLKRFNNLDGHLASEDTSGVTQIRVLEGGGGDKARVLAMSSGFVDSVAVIGDAMLPRGYVDITDPPFYAAEAESTTNSAAIQAAIDTASARGAGGIYVPPGEFVIGGGGTSDIDINLKPGVNVVGAGKNDSSLRFAANATKRAIMRIDADSTVTVADLKLDGNVTNRDYNIDQGRSWGLLVRNSGQLRVRDCWFEDCTVGVMMVEGGQVCDAKVSDNVFTMQTRAAENGFANPDTIVTTAIWASQSACGIWIERNTITGGYQDSLATFWTPAIYVDGPNAIVRDNWIQSWGHGGDGSKRKGVGIQVGPNATDWTLDGNDLTVLAGPGIYVEGDDGVVTGGRANRVEWFAVELASTASNIVIDPSFPAGRTDVDSTVVAGSGFPTAIKNGSLYVGTSNIASAVGGSPDSCYFKIGGTLARVKP